MDGEARCFRKRSLQLGMICSFEGLAGFGGVAARSIQQASRIMRGILIKEIDAIIGWW
jgi:hypothetical protein